MKVKNLIILLVLAVILIGLAVLSSRDKSRSATNVIGTLILPDLPVNDVEKLVVSSSSDTLTVAKVEQVWVVPQKFNYPADFTKIRDVLLKLSELKIGQVIHVDESQRPNLKMTAPGDPVALDETGTLMELFGKENNKLASLLMGATHSRQSRGPQSFGGYPDGRYVSSDDGKNVYLTSETLNEISTEIKDWLDTDLINVPSSEIKDITISGPARKTERKSTRAEREYSKLYRVFRRHPSGGLGRVYRLRVSYPGEREGYVSRDNR